MSTESHNIEWKSTWRDEYLKWIAGFANAQGGTLFIGKNNAGDVIGVDNAEKLLEDIPNKVRDVLGIVVNVNLHIENDLKFIEVVVDPYPTPVSYKGQYHYRSGSTKQELKGAALDKFIFGKLGLHWDGVSVPRATISELVSLDFFRKMALRSKRIDEQVSLENDSVLIERLRLLDGEILKRAAILLFHPDPEKYITGAFIKIGYFESDSELLYQDEVHGNLFEQLDKSLDFLCTKYMKALISYEGVQRVETFPIPPAALREALLNAIAHKDYSSGAPIQISVYADKIMIWNTGQLYHGWTIDDLLTKHASQPYNPDIANTLFRAGLIEAWGRGIEKMFDACQAHGTPTPTLRYMGNGVWIEFAMKDQITSEKTVGETVAQTVGETVGEILLAIKGNPKITREELRQLTGLSIRGVEWNLAKLKAKGVIERIGPTKGGHWEVTKKPEKGSE